MSTALSESDRSISKTGSMVNANSQFPLKVSINKRYLVKNDGKPFIWLGDTAWEIFHRCTREDAELYLKTRSEQGYTVIQGVVIAENGGITIPTPYGQLPFHNADPTKPNEEYFKHVDWVIEKADQYGITTALLPTWADKVGPKQWGTEFEIFNAENARIYGEYLGKRYKDKPVIWVIGGDRGVFDAQFPIWRAMVEGIKAGDGGKHLMTYHPPQMSSKYWPNEPWLDFHMIQSGHGRRDTANFDLITQDYQRKPTKPVIDGEPCYDDHPIKGKSDNGWFDCYDVRKAAYRAIFAGAFGHTYGCHGVWQFYHHDLVPKFRSPTRTPWKEAIHLPGAIQMGYLRKLIESRAFFSCVPDQGLLVDEGVDASHARATRAEDGSFAMIYYPRGEFRDINLSALKGQRFQISWFNPRNGTWTQGEVVSKSSKCRIGPNENKCEDWVLVIDSID